MNKDTPLQGTHTLSQLDTNISVAVDEIENILIFTDTKKEFDYENFKSLIFNAIKQNIEGNVNWNRGG